MFKIIFSVVFCLSGCFIFLSPIPAQAAGASLYFAPATGTYSIDSQFTVAIKIDTAGENANATEGAIIFDAKSLAVTGVSKSGSVLALWTTEPSFDNAAGTLVFGGGMPRPAYQGTGGQVLSITFKAKAVNTAYVRFSSGAILANDGKGSNILTTLGSASLTISPAENAPQGGLPGALGEKPAEAGPDYNKPNIISPTHPDQNSWYNSSNVIFNWAVPDGTIAVSLALDKEPLTETIKSENVAAQKEYKNIADGLWYFHLRFKDGVKWGTTAHYRLMIDTMPPDELEIRLRQIEVGQWPELELQSKDKDSGIKKYSIIVGSLESQAHEVPGADSVFKFSNLSPGEHTALVRAIDNAGNEKVATINFIVEPIESPAVAKFSEEIKPADQFFITGTALKNSLVNVHIDKDGREVAAGNTQSDASGNWFFVHAGSLPNGRYAAWAEAVNENGLKSNPSNKATFLVSPPVFTRVGTLVINYFTVLTSLIFMIILIVISIIYLSRLVKKRLRKETVEVEYVLHRNIVDLNEIIDEEFSDLNKLAGTTAYNKDRLKLKQKIKNLVIEAEKKIMKEVKDVESMLK